jgi:hypothetical protein
MKNYEALEQFQNVQLTELWKGSPQLVPPILPITRGISEDRQPFTDTVLGSTACPNLQLYFTSVRRQYASPFAKIKTLGDPVK